jgi:hypothetical protein
MQTQFDSSYPRPSQFDFVSEEDNGEREKIQVATRFVSLALMLGDFSLSSESKAQPAALLA